MIQKLRNRREGGFTLIELLIVVAIIGIIAAILIPNLIDALQKAKQKRTVADMRTVGGAWFSWYTDQQSGVGAGAGEIWTWGANMAVLDYIDLVSLLRPTDTMFYIQNVPQNDAWGTALEFNIASDSTPQNLAKLHKNVMAIRSSGRDGSAAASYTIGSFLATDYDQDIVWADGYLIHFPGGLNTGAATP